jgi:hypothetical protein
VVLTIAVIILLTQKIMALIKMVQKVMVLKIMALVVQLAVLVLMGLVLVQKEEIGTLNVDLGQIIVMVLIIMEL